MTYDDPMDAYVTGICVDCSNYGFGGSQHGTGISVAMHHASHPGHRIVARVGDSGAWPVRGFKRWLIRRLLP